ncbi:PAS domain S-box protein [Craterilacuibacter sp.]|uniref:PAS domain S-box protein n=1 Tax=Craterilacuibacter sp. TaxID=2870909 RepID=UPI003F34295A
MRQFCLIAVVAGVLLPALIGTIASYHQLREKLSNRLLTDQQRLLEMVALGVQEPLWNLNRDSGAPLLDALIQDERIVSVRVTDALSGSLFLAAARSERSRVHVSLLEQPIVYRGEKIGVVSIEFDTRYLATAPDGLQQSLLWSVLAQLLLSLILLTLVLNRWFFKPMRELSEQVGDLTALRLDGKWSGEPHGEIGGLGRQLECTRVELKRVFAASNSKTQALETAIRRQFEVEAELRRSEGKYRELFRSSPDGILICAIGGRVLDANPAFLGMMAYTLEEIRMQYFSALVSAQSEEIEHIKLESIVKQRGFCEEFEANYVSRHGLTLPVLVRVVALLDENREVAAVWRIVRRAPDK